MRDSISTFLPGSISTVGTLAAIALLVWLIGRWRRQRGMSAAQLYFHLAAGASLLGMSIGAASVAGALLEEIPARAELTLGVGVFLRDRLLGELALVIVATPLWAFHWGLLQRRAQSSATERDALLRHAFLNVTLAAAAMVGVFLLARFVRLAITAGLEPGQAVAGDLLATAGKLAVAAAVWLYHQRTRAASYSPSSGADTLRRSNAYLVAGVTLAMLATGIGRALTVPLEFLFAGGDLLAGDASGDAMLRTSWAAGAVVAGAAIFPWHWLEVRSDRRTRLRLIYIALITAAGGLALTGAASWTAFELLRIALGHRAGALQWNFLASSLPAIAVGGIVFRAHLPRLRSELDRPTGFARAARRTWDYAVATFGLALWVTGAANLVRALIEFAAAGYQDLGRSQNWWRNEVSAFVVLILVGMPIWLAVWPKLERLAQSGGPAERRSLARRVYIYLAMFALLVASLVNAVGLVRRVLALLLGEGGNPRLLADLFGSASNLVIVGAVFAYFTRLALKDRAETAAVEVGAVPRRARRITALAEPGMGELVEQLEGMLGERVEVIGNVAAGGRGDEPAVTRATLESVREQIISSTSPNVLLLFAAGDVRVIGWEPR